MYVVAAICDDVVDEDVATMNEGVYMTIHLFLINAIYQMKNDESDSKDEDDDKIYSQKLLQTFKNTH